MPPSSKIQASPAQSLPSGGDQTPQRLVTACVLLIGDEILSGRTRDTNLAYIAQNLNEIGIQVREARVVPDIEDIIVSVVNEVRARYDYVFTTGGIGPTHDDITADSMARAFNVGIGYDQEALALLESHYKSTGGEFTESRKRMARVPHGATLIPNSISKAPGFQIGNVFVMAGIPAVMQAMLGALKERLEGGLVMRSRSITGALAEGQIAERLREIQGRYPQTSIGSYPFYREASFGTSIVIRGTDEALLESVAQEVEAMMREKGVEPVRDEMKRDAHMAREDNR